METNANRRHFYLRKCRASILLSSDIRFVGIFARIPNIMVVKCGLSTLNGKFSFSAHYHGTITTATYIFDTHWYKVSTGLATDCKGFDLD